MQYIEMQEQIINKWRIMIKIWNHHVLYKKNYDENSNEGYIFEVDIEYLKNLHNLHSDLPFLRERMKKAWL